MELSDLKAQDIEQLRDDKRLGLCHGTFDVLHIGHLEHLEEARKKVDILVVGVTSDLFVKKGPNRPVFNQKERARILASLDIVDLVVIVDDESGVPIIEVIKPDYYFKGIDYNGFHDASGKLNSEKEKVEQNGGQIFFTSTKKRSSTQTINILGGPSGVRTADKQFLLPNKADVEHQLASKKVLVIGETIIDKYLKCTSLGKSSKHSLVAQQVNNSEVHLGGVLAVAKHISGLGANVKVLTNIDEETSKLILPTLSPKVQILNLKDQSRRTIIKSRYIDETTKIHLFETYDMDDRYLDKSMEDKLRTLYVDAIKDIDTILIVDYGHGLISDSFIDFMRNSKRHKVVANAQVNAGNRGLNSVKRYNWCDSLVLNGSEVQLEMRQLGLSAYDLVEKFAREFQSSNILITLGKEGLIFKSINGPVLQLKAYSDVGIIDRTGAGDALLSCFAAFEGTDILLNSVLDFCNLAGYFCSLTLGNSKSITLNDLYELADGQLN